MANSSTTRRSAVVDTFVMDDCEWELPHQLRRSDYIAMGGVMLRVTRVVDDGRFTFAHVADGRRFAVGGDYVLRLKRKGE